MKAAIAPRLSTAHAFGNVKPQTRFQQIVGRIVRQNIGPSDAPRARSRQFVYLPAVSEGVLRKFLKASYALPLTRFVQVSHDRPRYCEQS